MPDRSHPSRSERERAWVERTARETPLSHDDAARLLDIAQSAGDVFRFERVVLMAELDALEATPEDGGLGGMLRADLIARIEERLDVIGRA